MRGLNQKGSSLVSVLVAFAILMIGLFMFTTALYAALNLSQKAQALKEQRAEAVEAYYAGTAGKESLRPGGASSAPMEFQLRSQGSSADLTLYGEAFKSSGEDADFTLYSFEAP